jgi:hypothetical protein
MIERLRAIAWSDRRVQLVAGFIVAALASRVLFWIYTQRIWEDGLIFLTVARTFWEGHGLTHHPSEPHVMAFTSPVGEFIAVLGRSVNAGMTALRLASLIGVTVALIASHRICNHFGVGVAGRVLLYGYLAFDHLQVFFGMAGMETQVSTGVIFAAAWMFVEKRHIALGLLTGAAALCRPELMLWAPIAVLAALVFDGWRPALRAASMAAAIVVPWIAFATWYYGSPAPQSVIAKAVVFDRAGLFKVPLNQILTYCTQWWKHIAPFREYWIASAPVPDWVLQIIVASVALLAIAGSIRSLISGRRLLPVVGLVFGFAVYRTLYAIDSYLMWYLPPFTALFFFLAAYGLDWVSKTSRSAAIVVGCDIALAYAIPLFIAMPIDRAFQREIEFGVRWQVGKELNQLMKPGDTVTLEPLGYIGWVARDKTI